MSNLFPLNARDLSAAERTILTAEQAEAVRAYEAAPARGDVREALEAVGLLATRIDPDESTPLGWTRRLQDGGNVFVDIDEGHLWLCVAVMEGADPVFLRLEGSMEDPQVVVDYDVLRGVVIVDGEEVSWPLNVYGDPAERRAARLALIEALQAANEERQE
jgi:hypothetical protein